MNTSLFYQRVGRLFDAFCTAMPWGECSLIIHPTEYGYDCRIKVTIQKYSWCLHFTGISFSQMEDDRNWDVNIGQVCAQDARIAIRKEIVADRIKLLDATRIV